MTDDDDLRALLRHADPAVSLEPASPEQVANLVEETMSRTIRRWTLPVAAALVLIAAGAAWAVTRPAPEISTPVAAPSPSVGTSAGASVGASAATGPAVTLTTSGIQAKCREPQAAHLAEAADFAFEGTVSGVGNGRVTLTVTHVYKGTAASSVQVEQAGGSSEQMLGSGRFETAKSYLVSASDGSVLICGYSGEADAIGLRELYEAAF